MKKVLQYLVLAIALTSSLMQVHAQYDDYSDHSDFKVDGIRYRIVDGDAIVTFGPYDILACMGGTIIGACPNGYEGDVVIPETVTYEGVQYNVTAIDEMAFYACENLTSVIMPSSIISIGESAFFDSNEIKEIELPESMRNLEHFAFSHCDKLESLISPSSISWIGSGVVYECKNLKYIEIPDPDSGIDIALNAFDKCPELEKIKVLSSDPSKFKVYTDEFLGVNYDKCVLCVPFGAAAAYKNTNLWGKFKTIKEMPCSPMLENGKEWGYVNYYDRSDYHFDSPMEFYRLCCGPKVSVDGVEYTEILKYNSFSLPENPETVAVMREENGRVYIRYSNDFKRGDSHFDLFPQYNCEGEFLIYDFNMGVGDVMTLDYFSENPDNVSSEETVYLRCVETGVVDTEYGKRKFLKFDKSANFNSDYWTSYEYLLEGVGPLGNCDFTVPYRADNRASMSKGSSFDDMDLLYMRKLNEKDAEGNQYRGDLVYKAANYDVMGIYDPSEWHWPASAEGEVLTKSTKDTMAMPDLSIYSNFTGEFKSDNGVITEVIVLDVLGRELSHFYPNDTQFKLDMSDMKEMMKIVTVRTENGQRSFRLNNIL